jgi:hypothetical protein
MSETDQNTIEALIAEHAQDVAFAADQEPAATPIAFVDQLGTAAINLKLARMDDAEDVEAAAASLADALLATDPAESRVLAERAGRLLKNTAEIVSEYRQMVTD